MHAEDSQGEASSDDDDDDEEFMAKAKPAAKRKRVNRVSASRVEGLRL